PRPASVGNFDQQIPRLHRSGYSCHAGEAWVAAHKLAQASRGSLNLLQPQYPTREFRRDRAAARKIALAPSSVRLVQQFSSQHADIGQIAITSPEIESVTDYKFVFDFEPNIIRLDFPGALFLFAQQHAYPNALRPCRFQRFANRCERVTAIQNIIQDQNIAAHDIGKGDLLENDLSAGLRFAVITGHAQTLQLQGKRNSWKQVSHEHQAPVQHCDHG